MLNSFNEDLENLYENIGSERYADANTPYWGQSTPEIRKLSPLAQSLYGNIRRAGDNEPFHLTRELYAKYKAIDPHELHRVIDTALEFNFQVSDEVWDMMKRLNGKMYADLRHSVGMDKIPSRFPPDNELFHMLRRHPEFGSTRSVKYKDNAGMFKYKDIKKRIRAKYQDQEQDLKMAELDKFIDQNRRYGNV